MTQAALTSLSNGLSRLVRRAVGGRGLVHRRGRQAGVTITLAGNDGEGESAVPPAGRADGVATDPKPAPRVGHAHPRYQAGATRTVEPRRPTQATHPTHHASCLAGGAPTPTPIRASSTPYTSPGNSPRACARRGRTTSETARAPTGRPTTPTSSFPPSPAPHPPNPADGPTDPSLQIPLDWLRNPDFPDMQAQALPSQRANRPFEVSYYQINHRWQDLPIVLEGHESDGFYIPRSATPRPRRAVRQRRRTRRPDPRTRRPGAPGRAAVPVRIVLRHRPRRRGSPPAGGRWPTLSADVMFTRSVLMEVAIGEMQHLRSANRLLWGLAEQLGQPIEPSVIPPALAAARRDGCAHRLPNTARPAATARSRPRAAARAAGTLDAGHRRPVHQHRAVQRVHRRSVRARHGDASAAALPAVPVRTGVHHRRRRRGALPEVPQHPRGVDALRNRQDPVYLRPVAEGIRPYDEVAGRTGHLQADAGSAGDGISPRERGQPGGARRGTAADVQPQQRRPSDSPSRTSGFRSWHRGSSRCTASRTPASSSPATGSPRPPPHACCATRVSVWSCVAPRGAGRRRVPIIEALPQSAVSLLDDIGLASALADAGPVSVAGFHNSFRGQTRDLGGVWTHVDRGELARRCRLQARRRGAIILRENDIGAPAPADDTSVQIRLGDNDTSRVRRHRRDGARGTVVAPGGVGAPGHRNAVPRSSGAVRPPGRHLRAPTTPPGRTDSSTRDATTVGVVSEHAARRLALTGDLAAGLDIDPAAPWVQAACPVGLGAVGTRPDRSSPPRDR